MREEGGEQKGGRSEESRKKSVIVVKRNQSRYVSEKIGGIYATEGKDVAEPFPGAIGMERVFLHVR